MMKINPKRTTSSASIDPVFVTLIMYLPAGGALPSFGKCASVSFLVLSRSWTQTHSVRNISAADSLQLWSNAGAHFLQIEAMPELVCTGRLLL